MLSGQSVLVYRLIQLLSCLISHCQYELKEARRENDHTHDSKVYT